MKQKYPNYRIFDGSSEMTNSNEANMSNASTADHDSPQMTSPTIQQEAVVPPIPKTRYVFEFNFFYVLYYDKHRIISER